MKKVILYIAMSLDGYIADKNGKVNWLDKFNEDEIYQNYNNFIKDIDTVIMGYNTYNQIITELSPNNWVYKDFKSYVLTHNNIEDKNNIYFTSEKIYNLIDKIKKEKSGKNIWILGGSSIVNQLIKENLIDEYYISVMPVILGEGIKLFSSGNTAVNLKLINNKIYNNGVVELIYENKTSKY